MNDSRKVNQVMVPIVGRPNVGKSTLFNQLVEEERAITASEPGVTRDRLAETVDWGNKQLTLVDTAGFQPDHPSPSPDFIVRQVEAMIEEGELILFLVDGREDMTSLDRRIVEMLRDVSERVILVVNKVDPGHDLELALSDYYELGFEHLVPVAALHRRNLEALRDKIVDLTPETGSLPPGDGISLSLTGRPNVGKSTLFNAVLGYDRAMVSDEPGTTRDVVEVGFEVGEQRFRLWDTIGVRKRSNIDRELEELAVMRSLRTIDFCDVACLVLDWNERVTKQDQRLAGLIADRYRGCIILVNKADQPDEENEQNWLGHLEDRLGFLKYAPVIFTSGRERRGLGQIFSTARAIFGEMTVQIPRRRLHNAFLDIKPRISWPSSSAAGVILQRIRQVDVNPLTFEVEADSPESLTRTDLRHLRKLLRDELNLELAPLKFKLVEEFDSPR